MDNSEEIAFQLPYVQDQKSLTLRWRSFSEWGSDRIACPFAYKDCQFIGYG